MRLAQHLVQTLTPPISAAYDSAKTFTEANPDTPLLDCAQGSPSSPPPDFLLDALAHQSRDPTLAFRYGLNGGELPLREALTSEIARIYGPEDGSGVDVTVEDVSITSGCNLAFFNALLCVAQAGDEVIIPSPWYFNHQMALTMLGIKPVPLVAAPDDGFIPRPSDIESLLTEHTKAVVLVSPNNPTGAIYPPETLQAFFDVAQRHNLAFLLDETYRDFVGSRPHNLFAPANGWRGTLVHLFSFSKSYAIPGARLGAVVADPAFIQHLNKALDTIQICPPRAAQHALAAVLPRFRPFIERTALELRDRQAAFKDALPNSWRIASAGGYFAFVCHPFHGVPASVVCHYLASEHGVVMLPAECFGYGASADKDAPVSDERRWIRASVAAIGAERMPDLRRALLAADSHFTSLKPI